MRVIICGGRDFYNHETVFDVLNRVHSRSFEIGHVITGGAPGADTIANKWAEQWTINHTIVYAKWKQGSDAGPARNTRMLLLKPHLVIAFPGGPGTANMIGQAHNALIPILLSDASGALEWWDVGVVAENDVGRVINERVRHFHAQRVRISQVRPSND